MSVEEFRDKLLKEMEEIPEEWKEKLHEAKWNPNSMYYTHYGPGRDFTEGYDWILVYFSNKMSAKIFLNKHHKSCF